MTQKISLSFGKSDFYHQLNMTFHINTKVVESHHEDGNHSSVPPIYVSTTFMTTSVDEPGVYDYTRSGNPTRTVLQETLKSIMNAKYALAVNSGMACLDIIVANLSPNDEIIAGEDLYGGSDRLLQFVQKKHQVAVKQVDTTNLELVKKTISLNTKMVLLESPTNPLINVIDVRSICDYAHKVNPDCIVIFDNTMMSPLLMSPLELGADIHYESGTKYLNGHHDIMAGVLATNRKDIFDQLFYVINATGSGLAPFDCWLLLRGLKTLSIRVERQQENAMKLAHWIESQGFKVRYTGLKSHPQHELHFSQATGAGSVLSFETGSVEFSSKIVDNSKLFHTTVSFGAINSLISLPGKMSHASIDPSVRAEREFPEDLIRICVGIEDIRDIIGDLEMAINKSKRGVSKL